MTTPAFVDALPGRPSSVEIAERRQRALAAYVNDDLTLEEIAVRWGVCRERIRQYVVAEDNTLYRLARRRRAARQRLRSYVERGSRRSSKECGVCGERFEGVTGERYCCRAHYACALSLRYTVDPVRRATHDRQQAAWNLRNDRGSKTYAENVLAGTVRRNGRWLVVGSVAFHWALRAQASGWPIAERFPDDVREQLRSYLAGER